MERRNKGVFPPVRDLVDAGWFLHAERLISPSLDEIVTKSNGLGIKRPIGYPQETLKRLSEGLLLDVGCGSNFGFGSTFIDVLPNAYGIDPMLTFPYKFPITGEIPKDRVVGGFAEDMPFHDNTFRTTVSLKCVGWYPNVTVNPYWAISEMIRVTENGGLVTIHIGQREENGQIILDAAEEVMRGPFGDKIAVIKDFTSAQMPQVSIRLN